MIPIDEWFNHRTYAHASGVAADALENTSGEIVPTEALQDDIFECIPVHNDDAPYAREDVAQCAADFLRSWGQS